MALVSALYLWTSNPNTPLLELALNSSMLLTDKILLLSNTYVPFCPLPPELTEANSTLHITHLHSSRDALPPSILKVNESLIKKGILQDFNAVMKEYPQS